METYNTRSFDDLQIGESAWMRRTITEADIVNFAGVSGDFNPLHTDEPFAQNTMFKGRIAHGFLIASFISNVIGNQLPGPGGIYVKQSLTFTSPVRIGDTITTRVEIVDKVPEKKRIIISTTCTNQDDEKVLVGQADLLVSKD